MPTQTEPLTLRQSSRDFSKPAGRLFGDPINMYRPTTIAKADFNNSVRLQELVKDGKIYLSLSDAIALALENNYDIAIARYYLDIADTDILRAKAGSSSARRRRDGAAEYAGRHLADAQRERRTGHGERRDGGQLGYCACVRTARARRRNTATRW